jgi:endoglucanase
MKNKFKFFGFILLALCVIFGMVSCDDPGNDNSDNPDDPDDPVTATYTVSGQITADAAAEGLPGATVTLKQGIATVGTPETTTEDGTYTISDVANGTYTIEVSKDGFGTGTITSFTVAGKNVTGKNLMLIKAYAVSGKITNPANANLGGATVTLKQGITTIVPPVTTAANGTYTITNVVNGSYTIHVSKSEYTTVTIPVTVADANVTDKDCSLTLLFDLSAMNFVGEIKAGLNLGNCFDAYVSGDTSKQTVAQLEMAWTKRQTTLSNIRGIKAGGFNIIRIPVTWSKALDTSGGTIKIRSDWMRRITEVVDWALDEGMFVLLNTHHDSTSQHTESFIFPLSNAEVNNGIARFRAIWSQIAANFKSYPPELIFQGLNEPTNGGWNGTTEYFNNLNKYYEAFVDEVRKTGGNNAKRFLVCNTYAGGGSSAHVNGLILPTTDTATDKLIVGFHSYQPSGLCLAGSTSTWNGSLSEAKSSMDLVYNKFVSKGVPAMITEFGIMNKNNMTVRKLWTETFVSEAKKLKMPCIWWDDGVVEIGVKPELLGFYDRFNDVYFWPELLEVFQREAGLIE